MTKYIELIKSFKKSDFENGVNLHIHSTFSDGESQPQDIVKKAKEKSYKYIAISDHNTLEAYLKTEILKDEMVIPAIEFDCWCNSVFYHLLAYGIDVNSPALKPFLATTKKQTEKDIIRLFSFNRHPQKLIPAIHKAGGIAVLAHPACSTCLNLDSFVKKMKNYGLDGLELYYPYSIRLSKLFRCASNEQIEKLADKYDLIKTGGTDFHGKIEEF